MRNGYFLSDDDDDDDDDNSDEDDQNKDAHNKHNYNNNNKKTNFWGGFVLFLVYNFLNFFLFSSLFLGLYWYWCYYTHTLRG